MNQETTTTVEVYSPSVKSKRFSGTRAVRRQSQSLRMGRADSLCIQAATLAGDRAVR
jgi:hypothetical protein